MNIHPILVHFPIAMLVIYAVFEIARFRFLTRQSWYEPTKVVLLAIGVLSSFVALSSGEVAADIVGETDLVEMHSAFAVASTWIFSVLLIAYIVHGLAVSLSVTRIRTLVEKLGPIWRALIVLARFILKPSVAVILAILGLMAITVTGALGGAIVYGPDIDPIVSFVYHLFF